MNAKATSRKSQVSDLSEIMSSIIEELKQTGKYPAVRTYTATLNSFTQFAGGKGVKMPVKKIFIYARLKEYQDWLLQKGLSWNSISTYMRTLRAVFNRLFPHNCKQYDPTLFKGLHTKISSYTKRSLTKAQMHKLLTTNSDELPKELQDTLSYLILMFFFRGMPFIDLIHLRKQDMKGNIIVYCRHKTNKPITVHIPKRVMLLIKKCQSTEPDSLYLFPFLNKKYANRHSLYNNYLNALHTFNKQLKKLTAILLPGIKISSYTIRHTWATLAFHAGASIGIISKALGHSSIRVTETYLKPFENEIIDDMNYKLITSIIKCKKNKPIQYRSL